MTSIRKKDDLFLLKREDVITKIKNKGEKIDICGEEFFIFKITSKFLLVSFSKETKNQTIKEIFVRYRNYEIVFV